MEYLLKADRIRPIYPEVHIYPPTARLPDVFVAPIPANEEARVQELLDLNVLDTLPEQAYDDITFLAARICDMPIALVSLVDEERQWFKSRHGLDATETPRNVAFCAHAILEPGKPFIIPDATIDLRFADNPLVNGDPTVRFYAGVPLVSASGHALGTLCVIDVKPRTLTEEQIASLNALGRQVMAQLELRATVAQLNAKAAQQQEYEQQLEDYHRRLEENIMTIRSLSMTDPLTGLHNRRSLMDKLDDEFARLARSHDELSLALIDVDNFKPLNDSLGHTAGDEFLEKMARLIEDQTRSTDFVARYGGDEFAVVFLDTAASGAGLLAERIRRAVDQAGWSPEEMSVSIGIAAAGSSASNPLDLITAADCALYAAKESGRNQVVVSEDWRPPGF